MLFDLVFLAAEMTVVRPVVAAETVVTVVVEGIRGVVDALVVNSVVRILHAVVAVDGVINIPWPEVGVLVICLAVSAGVDVVTIIDSTVVVRL